MNSGNEDEADRNNQGFRPHNPADGGDEHTQMNSRVITRGRLDVLRDELPADGRLSPTQPRSVARPASDWVKDGGRGRYDPTVPQSQKPGDSQSTPALPSQPLQSQRQHQLLQLQRHQAQQQHDQVATEVSVHSPGTLQAFQGSVPRIDPAQHQHRNQPPSPLSVPFAESDAAYARHQSPATTTAPENPSAGRHDPSVASPVARLPDVHGMHQETVLGDTSNPAKRSRKRKWKKPKDMPKRPLSAYNLFFADERKDMIKKGTLHTTASDSNLVTTQTAAAASLSPQSSKQRASSRSSKGNPLSSSASLSTVTTPNAKSKMGFAGLARSIAAKWRTMNPASRSKYEKQAEAEQGRYKRELQVWKQQQEDRRIFDLKVASIYNMQGLMGAQALYTDDYQQSDDNDDDDDDDDQNSSTVVIRPPPPPTTSPQQLSTSLRTTDQTAHSPQLLPSASWATPLRHVQPIQGIPPINTNSGLLHSTTPSRQHIPWQPELQRGTTVYAGTRISTGASFGQMRNALDLHQSSLAAMPPSSMPSHNQSIGSMQTNLTGQNMSTSPSVNDAWLEPHPVSFPTETSVRMSDSLHGLHGSMRTTTTLPGSRNDTIDRSSDHSSLVRLTPMQSRSDIWRSGIDRLARSLDDESFDFLLSLRNDDSSTGSRGASAETGVDVASLRLDIQGDVRNASRDDSRTSSSANDGNQRRLQPQQQQWHDHNLFPDH